MSVIWLTNCFLLGFEALSIGGSSCSLKSGQEPMADVIIGLRAEPISMALLKGQRIKLPSQYYG